MTPTRIKINFEIPLACRENDVEGLPELDKGLNISLRWQCMPHVLRERPSHTYAEEKNIAQLLSIHVLSHSL